MQKSAAVDCNTVPVKFQLMFTLTVFQALWPCWTMFDINKLLILSNWAETTLSCSLIPNDSTSQQSLSLTCTLLNLIIPIMQNYVISEARLNFLNVSLVRDDMIFKYCIYLNHLVLPLTVGTRYELSGVVWGMYRGRSSERQVRKILSTATHAPCQCAKCLFFNIITFLKLTKKSFFWSKKFDFAQ